MSRLFDIIRETYSKRLHKHTPIVFTLVKYTEKVGDDDLMMQSHDFITLFS